ncbi:MAG: HK97 gp10 family phage protein [Clostridia bacterium]|nr:HK97 gp10 family phage protein [Clostridia bacterium]
MSIKFKLEGFDDLISEIEKAGGTADRAANSCLNRSAQIMHNELKTQMKAANVDDGLIDRMPPPEVEIKGNRYTARVGYKKGNYDPDNPSDGYKVVFANYGTPRRSKHGQQPAKGFIQKAKKKANTKIKKAQKETLDKILGRLKG